MKKSLFAIAAAASMVLSAGAAVSGPYPFGDEPYTLSWGYPQVDSNCWKWNWQQYQWNDHCAAYVQPKAYMHPRSQVVLRTRG
jgi:hypothetical protein